jgi:hypothetical protein
MERPRLPNASMKYQTQGKWNPGRPFEGFLDCYIGTGAGHKAQVPASIMMKMMMMKYSAQICSVLQIHM